MGYSSNDRPRPRGEVWIRSTSNFIGYYKDPERTREALDPHGWCKTGDIAEWDELGRLRIIDRKKRFTDRLHVLF